MKKLMSLETHVGLKLDPEFKNLLKEKARKNTKLQKHIQMNINL